MTTKPVLIAPTPEPRWTRQNVMTTAKIVLGTGLGVAGALKVGEHLRTLNNCTLTYSRSEMQVPSIIPQTPYKAITFLGSQTGSALCRDINSPRERNPRESLFETDNYFPLLQWDSRP